MHKKKNFDHQNCFKVSKAARWWLWNLWVVRSWYTGSKDALTKLDLYVSCRCFSVLWLYLSNHTVISKAGARCEQQNFFSFFFFFGSSLKLTRWVSKLMGHNGTCWKVYLPKQTLLTSFSLIGEQIREGMWCFTTGMERSSSLISLVFLS